MGWWRTDDGGAVVGDGPVDLVIEAWHDIVAARAERGAVPPEPAVLRDRAQLDAPDRARLDEALEAAAVEYRQSELDREPTPREVDETLDFAVVELEAAAAQEDQP